MFSCLYIYFCVNLSRFVSLKDGLVETIICEDTEKIIESEREREQVEKEFMKAYLEDLRERGMCKFAVNSLLSWI